MADFQGGLVTFLGAWGHYSVAKIDGITGQQSSLYSSTTSTSFGSAIHPDGTLFLLEQDLNSEIQSVKGVNSATGALLFTATVPGSCSSGGLSQMGQPGLIVAGDGYAYVPYLNCSPGAESWEGSFGVLRLSTAGDATNFPVAAWEPGPVDLVILFVYTIGNSDGGVLLSFGGSGLARQLATVSAAGVSLSTAPPMAGQQEGLFAPVLQAEDGSYVGTYDYDGTTTMLAFTSAGSLLWTVPNEQPLMALEGGAVLAQSGVIYDQSGAATGQMASASVQSWTGYSYQVGSVEQIWNRVLRIAKGYWPFHGGNASGNGTAVLQPWYTPLQSCPGAATPCPQEAAMSALNSLRSQMQSNCTACTTWVFDKLPGYTQSAFSNYLNLRPRLWDGTRSLVPGNIGLCANDAAHFWGAFCQFGKAPNVHDYMVSTDSDAVTQRPSEVGKGVQIFFRPQTGICNVLSVSSPETRDKGVLNQALIFHEALHGFTGYEDNGIESRFGLPVTVGESASITYYLEGKAVSGGAYGATACQD